MVSTRPAELKKIGQERFNIRWDDGHFSSFSFRFLRQNCGCAGCRNELTGEAILNAATVPMDLKGIKVELVGNYAVHIAFSDGHNTGIFPFKVLREICPCEICTAEQLA